MVSRSITSTLAITSLARASWRVAVTTSFGQRHHHPAAGAIEGQAKAIAAAERRDFHCSTFCGRRLRPAPNRPDAKWKRHGGAIDRAGILNPSLLPRSTSACGASTRHAGESAGIRLMISRQLGGLADRMHRLPRLVVQRRLMQLASTYRCGAALRLCERRRAPVCLTCGPVPSGGHLNCCQISKAARRDNSASGLLVLGTLQEKNPAPMTRTILGGACSGKSRLAERTAAASACRLPTLLPKRRPRDGRASSVTGRPPGGLAHREASARLAETLQRECAVERCVVVDCPPGVAGQSHDRRCAPRGAPRCRYAHRTGRRTRGLAGCAAGSSAGADHPQCPTRSASGWCPKPARPVVPRRGRATQPEPSRRCASASPSSPLACRWCSRHPERRRRRDGRANIRRPISADSLRPHLHALRHLRARPPPSPLHCSNASTARPSRLARSAGSRHRRSRSA